MQWRWHKTEEERVCVLKPALPRAHLLPRRGGDEVGTVDVVCQEGGDRDELGGAAGGDGHEDHEEHEDSA